MSDKNSENYSLLQKLYVFSINVIMLFTSFLISLLTAVTTFLVHPDLLGPVLLGAGSLVTAFIGYRNLLWLQGKPDSENISWYVVPMTMSCLTIPVMAMYIISGAITADAYLFSRAAIFMTISFFIAYKLWSYNTKYFTGPLVKGYLKLDL